MNRTTHLDQDFGIIWTEANFQPYNQIFPEELPSIFTKTTESPGDPQDSCEGEQIILGESEEKFQGKGETWRN